MKHYYLMEAVHLGYVAIFEARSFPQITQVSSDEKLKYHQFKLIKDTSDNKTYMVATRNSVGKLIGMVVQIRRFKDDMWMVNFVEKGQSDFNITRTGSLDALSSVFSVIKYFIETESPKFIVFKATDSDEEKAAQKSRIYAAYFNSMGLTKEDSTESLKNLEIYAV